MKATRTMTVVLSALVAIALAGCSSATLAPPAAKAPAGVITGAATASISLGKVIVDGHGHTAYFFDHDRAGSGKSACTGGCSATWPGITSTSKTPTVSGVTGTVATIPDGAGKYQLTVDGMPIYSYSGDAASGDTNGQGIGGIWWVAGANGKEIRKAVSHGGY